MDDEADKVSGVDLKSGSERRMINRIASYWEEIKGDRPFPSLKDVEAARLEDIRANCFVIDISESVEMPVVRFVGEALSEGGTVAHSGDTLSSVPKRSLLGRISEHFLECVANGSPVGIEAEYDNDQGETVLYRGVVVPFSDDGEHIDFVLGAINSKLKSEEMAAEPPSDVQSVPETIEENLVPELAAPDMAQAAALLDTLSRCRHLAEAATDSMARSRDTLYTALAEAYAFRFEAESAPDAYAAILRDAGIEAQERAPYTPVIKLVFGADYDKTRLSEYAAALAFGLRREIPRQDFKRFLEMESGGIKACVAAERAARRAERGEAWDSIAYARSILREQPSLATLPGFAVEGDDEFVLLLGRRAPDGDGVTIVKLLHEKPAVLDGIVRRAAIGIPNLVEAPVGEIEPATKRSKVSAKKPAEAANENAPRPAAEKLGRPFDTSGDA
jgi:hypothetical protein